MAFGVGIVKIFIVDSLSIKGCFCARLHCYLFMHNSKAFDCHPNGARLHCLFQCTVTGLSGVREMKVLCDLRGGICLNFNTGLVFFSQSHSGVGSWWPDGENNQVKPRRPFHAVMFLALKISDWDVEHQQGSVEGGHLGKVVSRQRV